MAITRAAFTSGSSSCNYISAFGAHLFLLTNADDVTKILDADIAAATILCGSSLTNPSSQLRIAFDGDSVLFSDVSERIYQQRGLAVLAEN